MTTLKPVRTREDCLDWLTLEEVEREVFGAFVGAQSHTRRFDFAAYHAEASGNAPDYVMQPDTVLFEDGGTAWHRASFLEYMLAGVVWRLQALAKAKGVDLSDFDVGSALSSPSFTRKGFEDPYYKYLGGVVRDFSDEDLKALPPAERKALKASLRNRTPVTLPSVR